MAEAGQFMLVIAWDQSCLRNAATDK